MTPNVFIIWGANFVLKGIAEMTEFNFDLDARKVYVQTRLLGEDSAIEVLLEDFAIFNDGDSYRFILHRAKSNKLWLSNILSRITGKAWKIPVIPQLKGPIEVLAEVFNEKTPALEKID